MAVGVTEFSGTLYVPELSWQWQPRAVRMSTPDAVQAGLTTGKSGMVSESRRGQEFLYSWRTSTSLTTARPGAAAVGDIASGDIVIPPYCGPGSPGAGAIRGNHVHDAPSSGMAGQCHCRSGWSVVSGEVTPGAERQVKHQLWQVNGYEWTPGYAGLTARPDAFISGAESLLSQENGSQHIAGAWVTSLSDVRVNFPGAEEPVKRWQGSLTPVVAYF